MRLLSALLAITMLLGCSQKVQEPPEDIKEDITEEKKEEKIELAIDKSNPNWKQRLAKPELMTFKKSERLYWDMVTNKGKMSFRLFPDTAPMHVTSTIYLTELGFYDDVVFHRVIPGFMAQGGDPTGTGRSGPGYKYAGEFDDGVSHDQPGLLSMANAGPNTDGSQFFITFVPTYHLDGKHTIFGKIVEGMDTIKALESAGSMSGKPKEDLRIITATIRVQQWPTSQ